VKHKLLVLPCATQMGVEQYHSLKYNKIVELVGAAHNDNDELFLDYTKLNHSVEKPEFIEEVKRIVKLRDIDMILTSHDDMLYTLKNIPELESLIPGSPKEAINICRFKSKSYEKLKSHPNLRDRVPEYSLLAPGFLKPDRGQGSRGSLQISQDYVYCEHLPGREYTIDCFTNSLNEVIHVNPRLRKTIVNGISETTSLVSLPDINKIATWINEVIHFKGAWFFQMKEDERGNLKFLEIAPRIGGGSNINRLNGINLTLSDIYQYLGHDTEFYCQHLVKEVKRKQPRYNLNYDTIFVDYDDTFEYIKHILPRLNKEVIIITRSETPVHTPHQTVYVKSHERKSSVINKMGKPRPVFIDDSFKERKDVFLNCEIPCLTPEEVDYL